MTDNSMREFIDLIKKQPVEELEEGVLDSIKKWISNLNDPIKNMANEFLKDLQSSLGTKYGATVSPQIKSNNNSWMFGKLSYNYLYSFIRQLGFSDVEIDAALKNPIVSNTLNRMYALLPNDVQHPSLPLTAKTLKTSAMFISPMIDKKTKVYAARTIASIIFDSLAYIKAEAIQKQERMKSSSPVQYRGDNPYVMPNDSGEEQTQTPQETGLNVDELRLALKSIKTGLDNIKQSSVSK